MTDRELMQQALEALEAAEHLYHHVGLVVRRGEVEGVIASLRERLAQPEPAPGYCKHCKQYTIEEPLHRTHWEGCEEVHPECRKSATKAHELSDRAWAAIWEEFAWESEVTTDKEFQEEMVKKHGKGHYYMDAEEAWNRQKDLIQKLVNARLKEKNA